MTEGAVALVVFDLGGVLVRIVRSWAEAHERAGFPPDHPVLASDTFQSERAALALRAQLGVIDPSAWAVGIATASGGTYTPADATRILDCWLYDQYPGATDAVAAVERAGVGMVALSNTNARHWAALRGAGAPGRRSAAAARRYPAITRIHHAYPSHELGMMKPDPAIYAHVEADRGVAPGRILFFDDTPANVAAATARGWQAELVDPAADPPAQIVAALGRRGMA